MGQKRIAVIVRKRQSEALRMSVGLTVLDDQVEIFITEPLKDDQKTITELEGATELGLKVYSITEDQRFQRLGLQEMAEKLLEYDHIIPY